MVAGVRRLFAPPRLLGLRVTPVLVAAASDGLPRRAGPVALVALGRVLDAVLLMPFLGVVLEAVTALLTAVRHPLRPFCAPCPRPHLPLAVPLFFVRPFLLATMAVPSLLAPLFSNPLAVGPLFSTGVQGRVFRRVGQLYRALVAP